MKKAFSLRHFFENWEYFRSIPKTVFFNLWFFPFRTAVRCPVFVSHRVLLKDLSGKIQLGRIKTGIVKIGFGDIPIFDSRSAKSVLVLSGTMIFEGSAEIGPGCQIGVTGELFVGDRFAVTAFSMIYAKTKITFGRDVMISWDVSVIDQDWHDICDANGTVLNPPKPINIGANVWLCCKTLILKGSNINDGIIIAAGTTFSGRTSVSNAIVGGNNGTRVIREGVFWKH